MFRFTIRDLLWLMLVVEMSAPSAFSQDNANPGEALYGEWEIVEMVFHCTVQDFKGPVGGWFTFEKGGFIYIPYADVQFRDNIKRDVRFKKAMILPCVIRQREFDIDWSQFIGKPQATSKALYELTDGTLRIALREDGGERPTNFDEAYKDRLQTLFVLKKVK